jgi:hypothetical protein
MKIPNTPRLFADRALVTFADRPRERILARLNFDLAMNELLDSRASFIRGESLRLTASVLAGHVCDRITIVIG